MPLQGIFNADFTAFTTACAQAETSLKGFETGAAKTETALNRMADSISGQKIVQQAMLATKAVEEVGGAAVLTEKELARMSAIAAEGAEKLRLMGQTVPAEMQKLADATKTTADHTSTWSGAVSTLSGTFGALSLQRVIDEVIQFGKEVFNDADQLEKLKDKTGVSVETLQRLRVAGDEAGVGLDAITGSMTRLQKNIGEGSVATEGALLQLGLRFDAIKQMAPEQAYYAVVKALKDVEDQNKLVALGTELMGKGFADMLPAVKRGFDDTKDAAAGMSKGTVEALDAAGDATGAFYRAVKSNIGEAIADILTLSTSEWRRLKSTLEDFPKVGPPIANMWGQVLPPGLPADYDAIIAKSEELEKTLKQYGETVKAVQKIEGDHTKQAELNYLGLSKVENDFTQQQMTNAGKAGDEIAKINARLTDDYKKQSMDRADYENQKLWESAEAQIKAFEKTGVTAQQVTEFSNKVYEETANKAAEIEYTAATTLENITQQGIDDMKRLVDANTKAAADAAAASQQAIRQTYSVASSFSVGDLNARAAASGGTVARDYYGNQYVYIPGVNAPPGRAAGGPVSAGSSYMVGERGPELFVPAAAGAILPSGTGGTVVNHIYVNGTAVDVARQVAAEIMRSLRSTQQLPLR